MTSDLVIVHKYEGTGVVQMKVVTDVQVYVKEMIRFLDVVLFSTHVQN